MFKNVTSQNDIPGVLSEILGPPWRAFFVSGSALILLGVLVFVAPQILVGLISVTMILLGASLISLGWRARRTRHAYTKRRVWDWDSVWE